MGRMESWTDNDTDGGPWLKSWTADGVLNLMLHREPPYTRYVSSFRKAVVREGNDAVKRFVHFFRFVSMEDDRWHALVRRALADKKQPPPPTIDPLQKVLLHLDGRDDIAPDDVVFFFDATEKKNIVEYRKGDVLGMKNYDFERSLKAKQDFISFVIKLDKEPVVQLTNMGYSLMGKLKELIEAEKSTYGAEQGDPSKTPTLFQLRYDKQAAPANKYSVQTLDKGRLIHQKTLTEETWDAMVELWKGPAPEKEAQEACEPGDAHDLFEAMRISSEAANVELPLEELFAPALELQKNRATKRPETDFDPDAIEAEAEKPKRVSRSKAVETPEPAKEAPKAEAPKAETPPATPPTAPKKTRALKKNPPPPPPPPPAPNPDDPLCECGAAFPLDLTKCPSCGREAEDDDGVPAPPAHPEVGTSKLPWQK